MTTAPSSTRHSLLAVSVRRLGGSSLLVAALALLFAPSAHAQWTSTTNNANYESPSNWNGSIINGQFVGAGTLDGTLAPTSSTLSSVSFASGSSYLLTGSQATSGLVVGETITGTGIAAGTTILAINNAGQLQLSQATTAASSGSYSVTGWGSLNFNNAPASGNVTVNTTNGSTSINTGTNSAYQFAIGQVVTGTGIAAGTTITGISSANTLILSSAATTTGSVTLSASASTTGVSNINIVNMTPTTASTAAAGTTTLTLANVSGLAVGAVITASADTATTSGSVTSGHNQITLTSVAGLAVGGGVTGTNIPTGTTITNITGSVITISNNTTGTVASGATLSFATLASGTTISSINSSTNTITISAPTTASIAASATITSPTTNMGSNFTYENTDPASVTLASNNGVIWSFTGDTNNNSYVTVDAGAPGVSRTLTVGTPARTGMATFSGNAIFNVNPTTGNGGSGNDTLSWAMGTTIAGNLTKTGGGMLNIIGQQGSITMTTPEVSVGGSVNVLGGQLFLSYSSSSTTQTQYVVNDTNYNVEGYESTLVLQANEGFTGASSVGLIPTTSTVNLYTGAFYTGSLNQTIGTLSLGSGANADMSNTTIQTLTNLTRNNNATVNFALYNHGEVVVTNSSAITSALVGGGGASTATVSSVDLSILPWATGNYTSFPSNYGGNPGTNWPNAGSAPYTANDLVTYIVPGSSSNISVGAQSGVALTFATNATTITVGSTEAATLAVGQLVSGTNLSAYITAINTSTGVITLSTKATGASTGTYNFDLYNNAGFHPLSPGEFNNTFTSDTTANVDLLANTTLGSGGNTSNALVLASGVTATLNGPLTLTSGALLSSSGATTISGSGSINSGSNPLILSGSGTQAISVPITNSITGPTVPGVIVSNLAGTTLTGASTYGGFTEVSGKLTANTNGGGSALPTSTPLRIDLSGTVTIGGSSGTLQQVASLSGNGTLLFYNNSSGFGEASELSVGGSAYSSNANTVQVNSGGSISPGDASGALQAGTFILGTSTGTGAASSNLTLMSGAILNLDMASTAAGTSDQIQLTGGTLTLPTGTLDINYNLLTAGTLQTGSPYLLIYGAGNTPSTTGVSFASTGVGTYLPTYSTVNGALEVTFTQNANAYWAVDKAQPGIP